MTEGGRAGSPAQTPLDLHAGGSGSLSSVLGHHFTPWLTKSSLQGCGHQHLAPEGATGPVGALTSFRAARRGEGQAGGRLLTSKGRIGIQGPERDHSRVSWTSQDSVGTREQADQ